MAVESPSTEWISDEWDGLVQLDGVYGLHRRSNQPESVGLSSVDGWRLVDHAARSFRNGLDVCLQVPRLVRYELIAHK